MNSYLPLSPSTIPPINGHNYDHMGGLGESKLGISRRGSAQYYIGGYIITTAPSLSGGGERD